jgi:hypothetical protein
MTPLRADDTDDVRAQAGTRMFRLLLNVDLDIDKKKDCRQESAADRLRLHR